jgi:hypothetical protein
VVVIRIGVEKQVGTLAQAECPPEQFYGLEI